MFDQGPCSSFVMESAWPIGGVPLLLTCPSVFFPELFDRLLGSPMVSPDGDPVFGFFHVPPREAEGHLHVVALWFLCPACGSGWCAVSGGPCLGHVSSDQALFRQAGHVSSVRVRPICIEWERERVFRSAVLSFPIGAPSPTAAPFSLSRRRDKGFALFFHLFLISCLLPFSFLPRAFLRAAVVSRKEKGESVGEEKNSQILLRS